MTALTQKPDTVQPEAADESERPLGTLIVVFHDTPPHGTKLERFMAVTREFARDESGLPKGEEVPQDERRRDRWHIGLAVAGLATLIFWYSSWSGLLEAFIRNHFG